MKTGQQLFFALLAFAMTINAHGQSPREQFQQMVEQLRGNPTDNALRERIIKLARELNPAPAVPEEARRHFIRGSAIARSAKDAGQQALAVEAFKEALLNAPWWGDAYYNQGIAQELAGQWDAAERSFKLYILANPDGNEARDAQDRIYGLEGKRQLAEAESKKTRAAAQQAAAEAEARRFSGYWSNGLYSVRVTASDSTCSVIGSSSESPGVQRVVEWCKVINGRLQLNVQGYNHGIPNKKFGGLCEYIFEKDDDQMLGKTLSAWDEYESKSTQPTYAPSCATLSRKR